jgi:hypothetical protein
MAAQIQSKVNRNQRVAQTAGQGSKVVKSFYVMSAFAGKGASKLPVGSYATLEEAEEAAKAIDGYVVHLQANSAAKKK